MNIHVNIHYTFLPKEGNYLPYILEYVDLNISRGT